MRCPLCDAELRRSSSEPEFGLCDNCKKKFKWKESSDNYELYEKDTNSTASYQYSGATTTTTSKKEKKKKGGCLKYVLIAIVLLLAIGFLFGEEDDGVKITKSDGTTVESNDSETSEDEPKDVVISVGDTFEVGDLKITFNECDTDYKVEDDEYGFYEVSEGKKYIMTSFTFENIGNDDTEYVSIYDFDCYADNANCEQAYLPDDNDFVNTNLSKGRNVSFKTFYEIPIDAESIELEYIENVWTSDRILIKVQ